MGRFLLGWLPSGQAAGWAICGHVLILLTLFDIELPFLITSLSSFMPFFSSPFHHDMSPVRSSLSPFLFSLSCAISALPFTPFFPLSSLSLTMSSSQLGVAHQIIRSVCCGCISFDKILWMDSFWTIVCLFVNTGRGWP